MIEHQYLVERASESGPTGFEAQPEPPQGQYDVLLADPPWPYDFDMRGTPKNHYPTMALDEIKQLRVPAAQDAMLFLWTPGPKNTEGLEVIKSWSFEYKTQMVWVKDKIGTGHYVRAKHELLLIGKKGTKMHVPEPENRPPSVFEAPRTRHRFAEQWNEEFAG